MAVVVAVVAVVNRPRGEEGEVGEGVADEEAAGEEVLDTSHMGSEGWKRCILECTSLCFAQSCANRDMLSGHSRCPFLCIDAV